MSVKYQWNWHLTCKPVHVMGIPRSLLFDRVDLFSVSGTGQTESGVSVWLCYISQKSCAHSCLHNSVIMDHSTTRAGRQVSGRACHGIACN